MLKLVKIISEIKNVGGVTVDMVQDLLMKVIGNQNIWNILSKYYDHRSNPFNGDINKIKDLDPVTLRALYNDLKQLQQDSLEEIKNISSNNVPIVNVTPEMIKNNLLLKDLKNLYFLPKRINLTSYTHHNYYEKLLGYRLKPNSEEKWNEEIVKYPNYKEGSFLGNAAETWESIKNSGDKVLDKNKNELNDLWRMGVLERVETSEYRPYFGKYLDFGDRGFFVSKGFCYGFSNKTLFNVFYSGYKNNPDAYEWDKIDWKNDSTT